MCADAVFPTAPTLWKFVMIKPSPDMVIGEIANTKRLLRRNQYRIPFKCGAAYPSFMTISNPFRHNREEMRMSPKSKQNRYYLAAPVFAALIAMSTPMATASAVSLPDLVFPETAPVPKAKPDPVVTGSVPRVKKAAGAPENQHAVSPKAVQKGPPRSLHAKEAQR